MPLALAIERHERIEEKEGRNSRIRSRRVLSWKLVETDKCEIVAEYRTRREAKVVMQRLKDMEERGRQSTEKMREHHRMLNAFGAFVAYHLSGMKVRLREETERYEIKYLTTRINKCEIVLRLVKELFGVTPQ